jgi:hypothetical protein
MDGSAERPESLTCFVVRFLTGPQEGLVSASRGTRSTCLGALRVSPLE